MNRLIGIFDSGLGGLTVFKAIKEALPNETLVYLGDTARIPYGTRSAETIVRYSLEDADFLVKRGIKALVVACNTASAHAIRVLGERYNVPVLGVILPGAKAALKNTKNKNVGVIGTTATVGSNAYAHALKTLDESVQVISMPCPLFVSLVEEGWIDGDIVEKVAQKYLNNFKSEHIDTLILGCTHYPLLKNVIQKVVGNSVKLVDSAESLALELKALLEQNNLLAETKVGEDHIYVTDLPANFEGVAKRFLSGNLPIVKRVEL